MIQTLPYDLTEMRQCSVTLVIHLYPYHIHLEPADMCSQLEAPPHFSQVVRQYLKSWIPRSMDWSWQYTELATTVTGSEPIRLPCVGLHESYCPCTQGEHERRTYCSEFSALQEASTTLQCFVGLQILWSHEWKNASEQTEDTSNNLLECWTANL